MDCRPPGSSVHEILQARILDWVVMPFSGQSSWPRDQTRVSCTADRFLPLGPSGEPVNLLYWIPLHFVVFVHFLYTRRFCLNTCLYFMVFPTDPTVLSVTEVKVNDLWPFGVWRRQIVRFLVTSDIDMETVFNEREVQPCASVITPNILVKELSGNLHLKCKWEIWIGRISN